MSIYEKIGEARKKAIGHWKWKIDNEDDDSISCDVLGKLMGVVLENNNHQLPKSFEITVHYVSTKILKEFLEEIVELNVKHVKWLDDIGPYNAKYLIELI